MMRNVEPTALEPRPMMAQAGQASTVERVRLFSLIALTTVLIGLTFSLALPFLPAITWAVALAILAWPLHRWITLLVTRRGLAAAFSTMVVATVILSTGLFATYQIGSETAVAARRMQDGSAGEGQIRGKIASIPVLGKVVGWAERVGLDVEDTARKFVASNAENASNLARGSAVAAIQFMLAMFILYYLFRDRDTFLDGLRDLLPLSEGESNLLIERASDSVHATLYATVITGLIDSTAFGLTFWASGLPAPMLWSIIMFLLSLLPVLGAGLIWVPATAYLIMNGNWPGATALILVGVVTATFVDNILYARLAGARMRMHNVPVLLAFLGGLAVFGVSGMILGPAILAVTEATLEIWKRRMADAKERQANGGPREGRGVRVASES
ncbi:AI-2E family transporter [Isosphaeraceae bacterium EP7]